VQGISSLFPQKAYVKDTGKTWVPGYKSSIIRNAKSVPVSSVDRD
jgi:hypothetical protein